MTDQFLGTVDDNWFFAGNWSAGVPTATVTVTLAASSLLESGQAFAHYVTVQGGNDLSIASSGSLTTGKVAVNGASLSLASGGALYTSALALFNTSQLNLDGGKINAAAKISVDGASTVKFDSATTQVFGNAIAGAGSVVQAGGAVVLTGASTYSGTTTVGSRLQLGNGVASGSIGNGAVVLTNYASVLAFDNPKPTVFKNAISGLGLVHVQLGEVTLTRNNTYAGQTIIDAHSQLVIGDDGVTGSLGTSKGVIDNGELTFARSNALTVSAAISGSGGLTQQFGTLTLTGPNSYSGLTTVASGVLVAAKYGSLSSNTGGILVDSGATLEFLDDAGTFYQGGPLTLNGAGVDGQGALVAAGNAYYTYIAEPIELGSDATIGAKLGSYLEVDSIFGDGHNLTIHTTNSGVWNNSVEVGPIATGAGGVTVTGSGIALLFGINTYTGATTVDGGATLLIGLGSSLSALSDVVINNGTFNADDDGTDLNIGSLAGAGVTELTPAATLTTGGDNKSTVYSGVIEDYAPGGGPGALAKAGTGTFTLSGLDTYTGTTTVMAGALEILSAGTTAATGAIASPSIVIDAGATLEYSVADQQNDDYKVAAILSAAGAVKFLGPDGGIVTLSKANTYSGGTTIASGIVDVANAQALGSGKVTMTGGALRADMGGKTLANAFFMSGTIGLGALTTLTGKVTLTGNTTVTGSINDGSDFLKGAVSLGANRLTMSDMGPNTKGASWAGKSLTISGAITGTGGVTQASAGTLVLTGTDTFTGATTISGSNAVLSLSGAGSLANSAVSLAAGAEFDVSQVATSTSVANLSGVDGSSLVVLTGKTLRVNDAVGAPTLTFDGSATGAGSALSFSMGSTSFSLANASFENWAPGLNAIEIMGTRAGSTIVGSSQHDVIAVGGVGDTLTGGGGADGFDFASPSDGDATITDFRSAQGDYIGLDHNGFAGLPASGNPTSAEFVVGDMATLSTPQLVFDPSGGTLTWYASGNASTGVEVAKLQGVATLSATNIHMF